MKSLPASDDGAPVSVPESTRFRFIIEAGDKEALEIAIIENVQRTDLNALEEAQATSSSVASSAISRPISPK